MIAFFSRHSWRASFAFTFVVVMIGLLSGTFALAASPTIDERGDGVVANYSADERRVARPTDSETQIAAARLREASPPIRFQSPLVVYPDDTADLLFKWLEPVDNDAGLSAAGGVMTTNLPSALGLPDVFNWKTITFDRQTSNLQAFDQVSGYFDGSVSTASDPTSAYIPAYADLIQVAVSDTGTATRWQLTSRGSFPSLPEAYRLGYNNVMESGSQELVQFIGATPFTGVGWHWSVRDRDNYFPWWSDDLDVMEVGVDAPASGTVRFATRVDGALDATYGTEAAWPRFEWFIDADNDATTGDSFTFAYQEGSYVFRYDLDGVEVVASAFYDPASGQWLGTLSKKVSAVDWQVLDVAAPVRSADGLSISFPQATAGLHSTFRWGLVSSFDVTRGGMDYFGRADVAPNSGMKSETLPADPHLLLAEKYAPVLYLGNDAEIYPVSINFTLNNAALVEADGDTLDASPDVADLIDHAVDGSYLDFDGDSVAESLGIWTADDVSGRPPTMLARVIESGSQTIIQYWFHYFYSQWGYTKGCSWDICPFPITNNHEGDWEMIQLLLQDGQPRYAVYSQHDGQARRLWEHVEKQGTRPVVYVGYGSHAAYFKDSYYTHLNASEQTDRRAAPALGIEMLTSEGEQTAHWLDFRGIWGENHHQVGGSARGPKWNDNNDQRMKWEFPFSWGGSAEWDDEAHYGGLLSSAFRATVDGDKSREVDLQLRNGFSGVVILGKDHNTLDSTGRRAEFLLNCDNDARQTLLVHKQAIPIGSYVWMSRHDSPVNCVNSGQPFAATESITVTLDLTLPDVANGRIVNAHYEDVVLPAAGGAGVDLDSSDLLLEIDQDNNGIVDEIVPPTTLEEEPLDMNPPAAIGDLAFVAVGTAAELRWTAPADEEAGGAAAYEVRFADFPVTEATWSFAKPIVHTMTPGGAGTPEVLSLAGLPPGDYFFAVRSSDVRYNASALSNSAGGHIEEPGGSGLLLPIVLSN